MNKNGRPMTPTGERRQIMCDKFGIDPNTKKALYLTASLMDQIERCKTEECKRLLLGISR